jgi:hypothetical protein
MLQPRNIDLCERVDFRRVGRRQAAGGVGVSHLLELSAGLAVTSGGVLLQIFRIQRESEIALLVRVRHDDELECGCRTGVHMGDDVRQRALVQDDLGSLLVLSEVHVRRVVERVALGVAHEEHIVPSRRDGGRDGRHSRHWRSCHRCARPGVGAGTRITVALEVLAHGRVAGRALQV